MPGSLVYRAARLLASPIVRGWGRLDVVGVDMVPLSGARLIVGNHDSNWDPLVVGVALRRRTAVRALAKAELWHRSRVLRWIMNQMGQFKITRGRADLAELNPVRAALRASACVGIFPEGKLSQGRKIRAYSGAGWLAQAAPDTRVVAVALSGVVDLGRFPKRPRIQVTFFEPISGQRHPGESSIGLSRRVLAEIRDRVPPVAAGRR